MACASLVVSAIALLVADSARRSSNANAVAGRRTGYAPCLRVTDLAFGDTTVFTRVRDARMGGCTLKLNATGSHHIALKVVNTAPATATILFASACWSKSREAILKEVLDSAIYGKGHAKLQVGLLPGPGCGRSFRQFDTTLLDLVVPIPVFTLEPKKAILHSLLVYENPEGMIYGSYVWTATVPGSDSCGFVASRRGDTLLVSGRFVSSAERQSYDWVYDSEHSVRVRSWWDKQAEPLKKGL
jgi:hypothetical protein